MIADIVVAAVLLISGILALFRGFVKETLTIVGWVGAIFITLYGYPHLTPLLADFIAENWIAATISAAALFLVSLVILTIISHMISNRVQGSMLGHLDRALGFVFGVVRGFVLVCLVYWAGTFALEENDLPEEVQEARSLPIVRAGASFLASLVPGDGLPGSEDAGDQIEEAVEGIKRGVEDAARKRLDELELDEMRDEIDAEELLRRLNTPEPESSRPAAEIEAEISGGREENGGEGAAPAEALPVPPGYEDEERSDMQRLIESNQ